MDGTRFDALTRALGSGGSRRTVLKGLLGIAGIAAAGGLPGDAEAARRPTPTPRTRTYLGSQEPCDGGCCCPPETTMCGAECCPNGQAQCCDNACCYGTCYGEELCCPHPHQYCTVDGCCDGACVGQGQFCCQPEAVCGDACCSGSDKCCASGETLQCIPADACCSDAGCAPPSTCDPETHQCVCTPTCDGLTCGDDGCGGTCACASGSTCDSNSATCVPNCTADRIGEACVPPEGAGGQGICQEDLRCCVPSGFFAGGDPGVWCASTNCCVSGCNPDSGFCS
jgi:hypothetical protein